MVSGIYVLKPWFVGHLAHAERAAARRGVHPDTLTAAGVACAAAAGGVLAAGALSQPRLWLLAPPLLVGRLAANALDGAVARRTGRARPAGAVINELGDRAGDLAILAGLAVAGPPTIVAAAAVTTLLVSLVGVLAEALTGRRDTSGPMGKADRMLVVVVASVVAGLTGSGQLLAVAAWAILVGGGVTVATRTSRLMREVSR